MSWVWVFAGLGMGRALGTHRLPRPLTMEEHILLGQGQDGKGTRVSRGQGRLKRDRVNREKIHYLPVEPGTPEGYQIV